MGRVVLTHSTYIDGLIESAKLLAKDKRIKTVIPGVIGKTRGKTNKLIIRISRETKEGYKLIARKGTTYQEIFIVTDLTENALKTILYKCLDKKQK